MKIFLDDDLDNRQPEDESWRRVTSPQEFKDLIKECHQKGIQIEAISFDNDLGVEGRENEGIGLMQWLADHYPEYLVGETEIRIHSANNVAAQEMKKKLEFWRQHAKELKRAKNRPHPFEKII